MSAPKTFVTTVLALVMAVGIAPGFASAQDAPPPAAIDRSKYSPYPGQDFPDQVFFGDTHLHTSYSADAGLIGNTLGPEEAYRFARGETVTSSTGIPARLQRPYDFLVVADHAENLGLAPAMAEGNPRLQANPWGKMMSDLAAKKDIESVTKAYEEWQVVLNRLDDPLKEETALASDMWQRITAAAEKYNSPGLFTAIIGFDGVKSRHRLPLQTPPAD
jgi:hypothetical protein